MLEPKMAQPAHIRSGLPGSTEPMHGIGDLAIALGGSESSFTGEVLLLIAKAQMSPENLAALRMAFPQLVQAYDLWMAMRPTPTCDELLAALAAAPTPEPLDLHLLVNARLYCRVNGIAAGEDARVLDIVAQTITPLLAMLRESEQRYVSTVAAIARDHHAELTLLRDQIGPNVRNILINDLTVTHAVFNRSGKKQPALMLGGRDVVGQELPSWCVTGTTADMARLTRDVRDEAIEASRMVHRS